MVRNLQIQNGPGTCLKVFIFKHLRFIENRPIWSQKRLILRNTQGWRIKSLYCQICTTLQETNISRYPTFGKRNIIFPITLAGDMLNDTISEKLSPFPHMSRVALGKGENMSQKHATGSQSLNSSELCLWQATQMWKEITTKRKIPLQATKMTPVFHMHLCPNP